MTKLLPSVRNVTFLICVQSWTTLFTYVLERCQSITNHDTLMAAEDTTVLFLGPDPAGMLVSSTGTFISNNKMKTNWHFSFSPSYCYVKEGYSSSIVHSLSNDCVLMPSTLLKAQDLKVNYPQSYLSEVHNQKKGISIRTCSKSQAK